MIRRAAFVAYLTIIVGGLLFFLAVALLRL